MIVTVERWAARRRWIGMRPSAGSAEPFSRPRVGRLSAQVAACRTGPYLLARDGAGTATGVALAVFRRSPWPVASLIFRTLRLTAHPVVADAADAGSSCGASKPSRAMGCNKLTLESFAGAESRFRSREPQHAESQRVEFLVDLAARRG